MKKYLLKQFKLNNLNLIIMKNFILIIAFGLCLESVFAQTSNSCVTCNNNVIDTTKFSSAVGSENISTGLTPFDSGSLNHALGNFAIASGYEVKVEDNF